MRKWFCVALACALILSGCASESGIRNEQSVKNSENTQKSEQQLNNTATKESLTTFFPDQSAEPEMIETDWSQYFHGLNGAAAVYNAARRQYNIYNLELALTQRSPCSTFKIISSLIALESGIIQPNDSVRRWSGEPFWNEEWNQDLDFNKAFRASCVWYFREVVNEIGKEKMQEQLNKLHYGNCDVSDWEGRLNTNNNNRALTGFWIESSLAISPKEQVDAMFSIFGEQSVYSEQTRDQLKQVMLLSESGNEELLIYGKTGMGKAQGVVVDAWFTGFAENAKDKLYFCVYLGETDEQTVSSAVAKEIAIEILSNSFIAN